MNKKIVVLYKKTGTSPVIKVITNIFEIKKMIVCGNLDMVRYENCIIVCNNKDLQNNKIPNIVLDFKHISGDFFLVGYNPKIKDFRSLTKEEIEFYKSSLDRKSFQYDTYKKWVDKCTFTHFSSDKNCYIENQAFEKNLSQKSNNTFEKIEENQDVGKMLEMILNIQAVILKFIKGMNGEQ